jgi:hypothetical protein
MKIISEPKAALKREMQRLQHVGPIKPLRRIDWQPGGAAPSSLQNSTGGASVPASRVPNKQYDPLSGMKSSRPSRDIKS